MEPEICAIAIEELAKVENIETRCQVLEILIKIRPELISRLLEEALMLQEGYKLANILVRLYMESPESRLRVLKATYKINDVATQTKVLARLAKYDQDLYSRIVDNLNNIRSAYSRLEILDSLGENQPEYWLEALDILDEMDERQEYNSKLPRLRRIAERIPKASFPRLFQSVEKLSNPYNKAQVLCGAAKQDAEIRPQVLALVEEIHEETSLASIFIQITEQVPGFFQTALETTRRISFEHNRAANFIQLARVTPIERLRDLLVAISEMTQANCVSMFCDYAESYIPDQYVEEVLDIVMRIQVNQRKAVALSAYLPRLSLTTLSLSDWQSYLHLLAHCNRSDLMQDLTVLHPAIAHLGGKEAVKGMVDAMREVCNQWK